MNAAARAYRPQSAMSPKNCPLHLTPDRDRSRSAQQLQYGDTPPPTKAPASTPARPGIDAVTGLHVYEQPAPPPAFDYDAEVRRLMGQQPAAADATERLVLSRSMTLRLHVGGPALLGLRRGGWHAVTLRLSNEMGLFDAQTFADAAAGTVRLAAVALGGGGGGGGGGFGSGGGGGWGSSNDGEIGDTFAPPSANVDDTSTPEARCRRDERLSGTEHAA